MDYITIEIPDYPVQSLMDIEIFFADFKVQVVRTRINVRTGETLPCTVRLFRPGIGEPDPCVFG